MHAMNHLSIVYMCLLRAVSVVRDPTIAKPGESIAAAAWEI